MNLTLAHEVLFETDTCPNDDPLLETATAFASGPADDIHSDELVIVVRPGTDECVAVGDPQSVLRAAVSVAAAVDTTPFWADAPVGDTREVTPNSLPDRVHTAAAGTGTPLVHIGRVELDDTDHAVAIWFESPTGVANTVQRRFVLTALAEAATRSETSRRAAALEAAASTEVPPADGAQPETRQFDTTDPDLDTATGLLTDQRLRDDAMELTCDEASVMVITIGDGTADLRDDDALQVADRLVDAFERTDLLARVAVDRFAVVSADTDRSTAISRARTVLDSLAARGGNAAVVTIGFAHEAGLVDIEDMLDSADTTATEGRNADQSRLLLVS